ncbi:uncharacterized protein LOC103957247 isoform X1 [Pyrus x bretschneideri]|uniref:uncharacterized protein LOC103957247 isoform X1 n=1 Tax=Pyrus x bretschneideri TaxID=225117 RepID=UPI00202FEFCB|nr:uncharacterized protein LOC103957247 isoform X1 [Pyrus x bretschneideri]
MGKRGAASRKEEMAQAQPHTLKPKATNASSETEEPQSEGPNPAPERVEQHPENASPKTNSNLRMQEKSAKPSHSRKRVKQYNAVVRRSLRIRNSVTPVENGDIEPVYETVSESETEDEQPLLEEPPVNGTNLEEGQTLGEKSMEEKMDYLLQLLEKMNSKENKRSPGFSESPEKRYKSLYIDSQKKIEALTNENHELTSKLEVAHAKLEGFEKGTNAFSEVMEKMKDVILVSTLSKATETFMNFSSQAARDALSPQDSAQDRKFASKNKRKKQS